MGDIYKAHMSRCHQMCGMLFTELKRQSSFYKSLLYVGFIFHTEMLIFNGLNLDAYTSRNVFLFLRLLLYFGTVPKVGYFFTFHFMLFYSKHRKSQRSR